MTTSLLNREQYLNSVTQMTHFESLKFAKQALTRWDDFFSWKKMPCLCLHDENGDDVCYLFYHISKDNKYLTIDNLFTPYPSRLKGYAKQILTILFNTILNNSKIQRVKMFCVSSSLKFYMSLGIDFWGVNETGQYYTDFPMPQSNIDEIHNLMQNEHFENLSNEDIKTIYNKVKENGILFDNKKKIKFKTSLLILKDRFRFQELYNIIHIKI